VEEEEEEKKKKKICMILPLDLIEFCKKKSREI
jgi:hypothetical protein